MPVLSLNPQTGVKFALKLPPSMIVHDCTFESFQNGQTFWKINGHVIIPLSMLGLI